jgi:hypothetical protein
MKKLMIAILFLIPLIIIMTVNVSGIIISAAVNISVEQIILKYRGEEIDYVDINFNEYDEYKYYKIDAVCYPKIAHPDLVWTSSDKSVAYVEKGKVYFVGYGEVEIFCYSKDNVNVFSRCTFYVSGDTIYSVGIAKFGMKEPCETIDIAVYERILLDKIIIPANALKDKRIMWESSNEKVLTVDANGVIEGIKTGKSRVTMSIEEDGIIHSDTVTVNVINSYNYLIKDEIYISGKSVDISDYTINKSFVMSVVGENTEATVNGSELIYTGTGHADIVVRLNYSGIVKDMTVHFTDGDLLLGYLNLDILNKTVWNKGNTVWSGSACYVLTPTVLNDDYTGAIPKVTFNSSDEDNLEVDNGVLIGRSGGISDITISAQGFVDAVIRISVSTPMERLSLVLDNADDGKGAIEKVKVFGVKTWHYNESGGGYIDNTYKLMIDSFSPANAEQSYEYRSSNTEYATVSSDGLIAFSEAGIGKSVIIYVMAKYPVSVRPVMDYYEFNLVDGVNIGSYLMPEENTDDAPVFKVFNELRNTVGNKDNTENAVFHSNVYVPRAEDGGDLIYLYGDIYGNGYKFDARYVSKNYGTNSFRFRYEKDRKLTFIRNLTINGALPTEDFMEYMNNGGTIFDIGENRDKYLDKVFSLKYCIIQYAFSLVYTWGGKVEVDGCVLRNAAGPAVNANNYSRENPDITIRNCIFSNIVGPVMLSSNYLNLSDPDQEIDGVSKLRLEGSIYIYNWKEVSELRTDVVPPGVLPDYLNDAFNDKINTIVKTELKKEKYDILKVEDKDPVTGVKGEYVNFGIFIIGVWYDASKMPVTYDSKNYLKMQIDVKDTEIPLMFSGFVYPCYLISPKNLNNTPTTMPHETYELNEQTLKRLKGE